MFLKLFMSDWTNLLWDRQQPIFRYLLIGVLALSSDFHCSDEREGQQLANTLSEQAILKFTLAYGSWKLQSLHPQIVHCPPVFNELQDKLWVQSLIELTLSNLIVFIVKWFVIEWKIYEPWTMDNWPGPEACHPTYSIHFSFPLSLPPFSYYLSASKRKTFCTF